MMFPNVLDMLNYPFVDKTGPRERKLLDHRSFLLSSKDS
jgi:hypothetical protein